MTHTENLKVNNGREILLCIGSLYKYKSASTKNTCSPFHLEAISWSVFDNRKPLILFGCQVYAWLTQLHHSLALLRSSYVNVSQSFAPSSRVTTLHGPFEAMFGHHE